MNSYASYAFQIMARQALLLLLWLWKIFNTLRLYFYVPNKQHTYKYKYYYYYYFFWISAGTQNKMTVKKRREKEGTWSKLWNNHISLRKRDKNLMDRKKMMMVYGIEFTGHSIYYALLLERAFYLPSSSAQYTQWRI